jgi:S-adenosylmethionine:tRNA ribosyltransferase-isomerase
MMLSKFDYNLPKELIAQKPMKPRDHSRLLVLDKKTGKLADQYFYDIFDHFQAGDVLVLNNTKVFPARLIGKKKATGGRIEVFLLQKKEDKTWECLMAGHGRKEGLEVEFGKQLKAKVLSREENGNWLVQFSKGGKQFMDVINHIGITPLPPYIKRNTQHATRNMSDKINYQTVYADAKKIGSVAAPTAGLHFTPGLLKKIKAKGVEIVYVTLHVGQGTFEPVKVDNIKKHKMHQEFISIEAESIKKIYQAKYEGRRIIAVGTTSARTLESVAEFLIFKSKFLNKSKNLNFKNYLKITKLKIKNFSGWTDIFIYPGYKFKIVDGLITNFHLPKSTLLMLVSAMAGRENILKAYRHAIRKKYRFYSYGDAMLITQHVTRNT